MIKYDLDEGLLYTMYKWTLIYIFNNCFLLNICTLDVSTSYLFWYLVTRTNVIWTIDILTFVHIDKFWLSFAF